MDKFGPGPAGVKELQDLFLRFISLSVGIAFIILLVMISYGGIRFITSGGDPKNLQSARQMILWAILGIFFLAAAWIGLRLVEAFTGVPLTHFCLPGPDTGCSLLPDVGGKSNNLK